MIIKNFKLNGNYMSLDLCNDSGILYSRWENISIDFFISIHHGKDFVDDLKEMLYNYQ